MTMSTDKSPSLLMWIAGIAVILFSAAGIAAIMGWIPTSIGHAVDYVQPKMSANLRTNIPNGSAVQTHRVVEPRSAPRHAANYALSRASCAECGVIESTRAIEKRVKSTNGYEVTVRLDDGLSRVVSEANTTEWRTGDHVRFVGGAIQANP